MKELMKNFPVFAGLSDDDLGRLAEIFTTRTCEKDEDILVRDDTAVEFYVVAQGMIESTITLPGNMNRKKNEYGPGDFFGEISLFAKRPALNGYRAARKSVLLVAHEPDLRGFIEVHYAAGNRLISNLLMITIRNLRSTSAFLADVVQWGENASRRVITDELTGVYNRAFLDDAMENFFSISLSNKKPLSLLMIDIDNFRAVNERLDHETGNRLIVEVASIIKNVISDYGIIARYGGDEFSVLLPEADLAKAHDIAERIRSSVQGSDFSKHLADSGIPVTTSIGISAYPETVSDFAHFKEKADSSLYRAKELGRNRVAHFE